MKSRKSENDCVWCGKEFTSKHQDKLYCSNRCRRDAQADYDYRAENSEDSLFFAESGLTIGDLL